jgi:hypothetical protein
MRGRRKTITAGMTDEERKRYLQKRSTEKRKQRIATMSPTEKKEYYHNLYVKTNRKALHETNTLERAIKLVEKNGYKVIKP